jgi:hypothetical protein
VFSKLRRGSGFDIKSKKNFRIKKEGAIGSV